VNDLKNAWKMIKVTMVPKIVESNNIKENKNKKPD
jgi:hypothetical protein